jgi:nucleotide-binding universal stress UspA family protein
MKSILVATDFSPSADNAMNYAARLAQSMGATVILLHVYQIPISMSDVPVLMVSSEELRNNADMGLKKSQEMLQKNFSGVEVQTESRLGDVVSEISELCEKYNPLAVVVGKHGASGVERFLFGSTALSVIRASATPVIAVPDSTSEFKLQKIALASDGSSLGHHEEVIKNFVHTTGARLHVVHVKDSGNDRVSINNILPDLRPVYDTITGNDYSEAIATYLRTNDIDMLIVLPHRHSLMERLLFKTHTAELVKNIPFPVMTIGED